MTYENLIKKNQDAFGDLFDKLSIETKFTDDHMECLLFGICDFDPRKVEEFPFFIINLTLF